MSSILTNNGAMVALQTLQSINKNMATTQSEISTGKSVANAKDNAAVWAISKQMESDVQGFSAISESLALGESTVAVARNAAETVTDLLTEIKSKIVAAQEENVDRAKIQADIDAMKEQIGTVVGAAQFNGLNLVDGSGGDEAVNILSSLDRKSDGTVSASSIEVQRQNLSVTEPVEAAVFGTTDLADAPAAATLLSIGGGAETEFADLDPLADASTTTTLTNGGAQTVTINNVAEGNSYEITLGDVQVNVAGGGSTTGARTFQYVAAAGDGTADVAANLSAQISAFFGAATEGSAGYSVEIGANANEIVITNGTGTTTNPDLLVGLRAQTGGTPGSGAANGGLGALQTLDVTTDTGATGALAAIDGLIDQAIDASAAFGSVQSQIETQSTFVGKLSDSLTSGIGALVDANMEETSARLQALQVQQQLATQSLSIANQAPQSILSLFR